jgi:hypothetical protein
MDKKNVTINGKNYPKDAILGWIWIIFVWIISLIICFYLLNIASIKISNFLIFFAILTTCFIYLRISTDFKFEMSKINNTELELHDKIESYYKWEKRIRTLFHLGMLISLFLNGNNTNEAALARLGIIIFSAISFIWNIYSSNGYSTSSENGKKQFDKNFQIAWGLCPHCNKKISRGASKCPNCTADLI